MEGPRKAKLGRDGEKGRGHCERQKRRGGRAPGGLRREAPTSAAAAASLERPRPPGGCGKESRKGPAGAGGGSGEARSPSGLRPVRPAPWRPRSAHLCTQTWVTRAALRALPRVPDLKTLASLPLPRLPWGLLSKYLRPRGGWGWGEGPGRFAPRRGCSQGCGICAFCFLFSEPGWDAASSWERGSAESCEGTSCRAERRGPGRT